MEALVKDSNFVLPNNDHDSSAGSNPLNGQGESHLHAISANNAMTDISLTIRNLVAGHSLAHPVIEVEKLDLKKGEVVAMVGLSGCGKTTLLLTIAGLLEPISGEILFEKQQKQCRIQKKQSCRHLTEFSVISLANRAPKPATGCQNEKAKKH